MKHIAIAASLFIGVSGHWIDPDSKESALSTVSLVDGRTFDLVFSDEFNREGRSFNDGYDPRWTAIHKDDYTNTALQFYDQEKVTTSGGYLNITTTSEHTDYMAINDKTLKYHKKTKTFKSGMVQTWNKFCFTGGIMEVRAKLPGEAHIGGLWPAIWLMGNLARATYVSSSDWIWPWSFDSCDRELQPKQIVSACSPSPHYGMNGYTGRGAPEIDLLEAMPGNGPLVPSKVGKPYYSTSLQVAPGVDASYGSGRPGPGGPPMPGQWYEHLEYGPNSSQNIFFYGTYNNKHLEGEDVSPKYSYWSDAVSGNTQLNPQLWDAWHNHRLEWALPQSLTDNTLGYVRWYMDDKLVYGITGSSIFNKTGAMIPTEPQYILLNTAMSSSWGFPQPCPKGCDCTCYDCADGPYGKCGCGIAQGFCASLPAHFLIDYVRIWQFTSDEHQKVGCSTPERPSKKWIEGHLSSYMGPEDSQPLQEIQVGGASCKTAADCGGHDEESGNLCVAAAEKDRGGAWKYSSWSRAAGGGGAEEGACVCGATWAGPRCLAHAGRDPVDWDPPPSGLGFVLPVLPSPLKAAAVTLFGLVAAAIVFQVAKVRQLQRTNHVKQLSQSPSLSYRLHRETSGSTAEKAALAAYASSSSSGGGYGASRNSSYTMLRAESEIQLSNIPRNFSTDSGF